jgi:hypothetical protein
MSIKYNASFIDGRWVVQTPRILRPIAAGDLVTGFTVGKLLIVGAGGVLSETAGASSAWGGITGTLADQTDLQTALNIKANLSSPTFSTSVIGSYLTASEMLITNGSKGVVSAPVATYPSLTELTYLKGVTSALQTQLGLLAPKESPSFTGLISGAGADQTGSGAIGLFDLSQTWNTTGTPTAIKLNVTNTASNSLSLLLDLKRDNSSRFAVGLNGFLTISDDNDAAKIIVKSPGAFLNVAELGQDQGGFLRLGKGASNLWGKLLNKGVSGFFAFGDGSMNYTNNVNYTGIKRDGTGIVIRNGADSAYGAMDASAYKASGVDGFTGTGSYTSFTIVGGIITSAS